MEQKSIFIKPLCAPTEHRFEIFQSRPTCVICGQVSREPRFVNDDRMIRCANMQKQYVPKPRKPKKTKESK